MAMLCFFSCTRNKCDCPVQVIPANNVSTLPFGTDTSKIDCTIYANINKYLKESLKDYSSYQPISFSEFEWVKPDSANKIATYLADHRYYDDTIKKTKQLDSLWNVYSKFKPIGYTIKHKYRAKNGLGIYDMAVEEFRLDTLFNVLYVKPTTYQQDDYNSIMGRVQKMKDNGELK